MNNNMDLGILKSEIDKKADSVWVYHLQDEIKKEFPRLKHCQVPIDFKAFEEASENRSALHEVARNSLARKSIATLTQCAYM